MSEKSTELCPLNREILNRLIDLHKQKKLVGKFDKIPIEVYHHEDCPGISNTMLSRSKKRSTKETDFGSMAHDALLLPDLFKEKYVIGPEVNKRTTEGKKIWVDFLEASKEKIVVSQDDYNAALKLKERVLQHRMISAIWPTLEKEVSFFFYEGDTLMKTRPDLHREDGLIFDYKTCKDVSLQVFKKEIINRNYDRSLVMQATGLEKIYNKKFSINGLIAIEKETLELEVYILGPKTIETGKSLYLRDIQRYHDYINSRREKRTEDDYKIIEIFDYGHHLENR